MLTLTLRLSPPAQLLPDLMRVTAELTATARRHLVASIRACAINAARIPSTAPGAFGPNGGRFGSPGVEYVRLLGKRIIQPPRIADKR